ncbi:RAP [Symbiodinium natans]|uniref:RAP protein n=1 Tax=Symbiodinium natans TaxID=878477 RepID=A0A812FVM1_9DINO|nr:RAP [Symbiodinium natans]
MEDVEELLHTADEMLTGFDMLNTITVLNRLSRLRGANKLHHDPRVLEVLYRIEAWLSHAGVPGAAEMVGPEMVHARHLASITTALARLQWKDSTAGRLLRIIASIAPPLLATSRARDLSNLAWGFATLDLRKFDSVMMAIAREAVVQISDFTEQNLSNTCWAFAKIGIRHDPLIKAIADETLRKLPQFSAQGLVNTLWGFATLVIKGEECLGQSSWQLICALLEEITRRLPDCTTQELSNSSWACCRLGVRHDGFMAAVADQGLKIVGDYTCQDLANSAMAFAKPNIYHRQFLEALAHHSARKMRQFEAREVSNALWSFTIIGPGVVGPDWLDPALDHFLNLIRMRKYEGWELVQVVNACWPQREELHLWPSLERTFQERVFQRVVHALEAIIGRDQGLQGMAEPAAEAAVAAPIKLLNAGPATHGNLSAAHRLPERLSPLESARRAAQRLIDELQVDFLGPIFTRVAMRQLGLIDPSDLRGTTAFSKGTEPDAHAGPEWGARARAAVAAALKKMREELPFMWFDRFGPHERRVISWIAFDLEVAITSNGLEGHWSEHLKEVGRITGFSLDEHRAMDKRGVETFTRLQEQWRGEVLFTLQDVRKGQEWLQGLFAQHDRAGHTERQALLEVILEIIGAIRRLERKQSQFLQGRAALQPETSIELGLFDGSLGAAVSGQMQVFVCHFCCISCMAAICNFARRFPHVKMHIDYDDCWRTRLLDV